MLYGITGEGGTSVGGTLFQMNPDGTDFQVLHNFTGAPGDGAFSRAGLTVVGSTLYGISGATTTNGGAVFRMDLGGTFQSLHTFSQVATADVTPTGFERPLVSGSTIYGTSEGGGANRGGAIFSLNTDGTDFQLLHSFDSQVYSPTGSLVLSGTTLYGVTHNGGTFHQGTVFEVNTDGTGFQVLHDFAGGAADGSFPSGGLVLNGSTLYGTTANAGHGQLFQLKIDGTGFQLLASIDGEAIPTPSGDLMLWGNTLYGTSEGSTIVPGGTAFSLMVPEPSGLALAAAGIATCVAWGRRRARRT